MMTETSIVEQIVKKRCSCGLAIGVAQQARHERSRWHVIAAEAIAMHHDGVSFADIARHFNLTRAYIGQKLHQALPACAECGVTMFPHGQTFRCDNCGENSGVS